MDIIRPAIDFAIVVHSGCSLPFLSVLVVGKKCVLSAKVIKKQNILKYFYTE
jgi:hypothetical protein